MDFSQCLKALASLTTLPSTFEQKVDRSKFDPFEEMDKVLQIFFEQQHISQPSTSTVVFDEESTDSRVKFSRKILFVFEELWQRLRDQAKIETDEYRLLSLKDLQVVKGALQLLILCGIAPYLDEGVGIPIGSRSKFIRSWKHLTHDLQLRRSMLHSTALAFFKLMESNEALRREVCPKFLGDIICANEQLTELGDKRLCDQYENFLKSLPVMDLAQELTLLSKKRNINISIPVWFQRSTGARLSSIVLAEDGLLSLLLAYNEMGDSSLWSNEPVLFQLASQLARVPQGINAMKYYEKISLQFIDISVNKRTNFSMSRLFALFLDVLDQKNERSKQAANVCVLDKIFGFWEGLSTTTIFPVAWRASADISLCLLSKWAQPNMAPNTIKSSPRLPQIVPLFLQFIGGDVLSQPNLPAYLKKIKDDLLKISAFVLSNLMNKEEFLISFILRNTTEEFLLRKNENDLVQEIGSLAQNLLSIEKVNDDNDEQRILRHITSVLAILEYLPKEEKVPLLVGCISQCTKRWSEARKMEETRSSYSQPRFVDIPTDPGLSTLWIHFAVGVLFEQLEEMNDFDCTNPCVLDELSTLVTALLSSTSELLSSYATSHDYDISARPNREQEEKLMGQNAKLAIGLAGGLILAAMLNPEIAEHLTRICESAQRFAEAVAQYDNANFELREAASEALTLFKTLSGEDLTALDTEKLPTFTTKTVESIKLDEWERMRLDLDDPCEAIRGQALLRISRGIREDYGKYKSILHSWLYDRIIELLYDDDSYVYLNAINALSEIAIADTNFLHRLVDLQMEWRNKEENSEEKNAEDKTNLLMRGRLSEATGKVFRFLGLLGPEWLRKLFPVFVKDLSSDEEILRAGALSAISDLIASCKGIGIDSEINEILNSTLSMLSTESSSLVRRAFVHLLREIIRAPGSNMILSLGGERLRDLRRTLTQLWKWDNDHIVRLHADVALQEMKANIETAEEASENPHQRIIQMD